MPEPFPKALPKDLTSYDFLKTLAVILMIVDHIGYYFYPENNWLRVIGRLCVPMWFFLIGYANTRALPLSLWWGGALLVVANIVGGLFILPLNILLTMIFVRLSLDKVTAFVFKGWNELWVSCFVLFVLIMPTNIITEYGTQALIMAIYGYMVRHRHDHDGNIDRFFISFSLFALISFIAVQAFMFHFSGAELFSLEAGALAVMGGLYFFRPLSFPRLTAVMPTFLVAIIQTGGRKTLEIYVIHLLLFKALAVMNGRFDLFDWTWTILQT